MSKGRILAIDYGEKNLGLAISDTSKVFAEPWGKIVRENSESDFNKIECLIREQEIEEIVIGLPKNLDGSLGEKAKETIAFTKELKNFLSKKKLSLPVVFWDERLTSKEAEKVLLSANLSRKKRKDVRDQIAACLILQNYLERKKVETER